MSTTFSHPLAYPVTYKLKGSSGEREETVTTVTLELPERLLAKHMALTDGASGDVGKTLALMANFSGLPVKVLEEMDVKDFVKLSEPINAFF